MSKRQPNHIAVELHTPGLPTSPHPPTVDHPVQPEGPCQDSLFHIFLRLTSLRVHFLCKTYHLLTSNTLLILLTVHLLHKNVNL